MLNNNLEYLPLQIYYNCLQYGKLIALTDTNDTQFSYSELAKEIARKYHALNNLNLASGDVVVLTGPLNLSMIGTMIGGWLARATILLLDGSLPKARQEKILALSNPRLIISDDLRNGSTLCMNYAQLDNECDTIDLALINYEWRNLPAYIVFTSGSTGEPKGILGSHSGLSHFINWQKKQFEFATIDKCAQFTSLGFDVIFRSVLTPLLSGAQLYLSPYPTNQAEQIVHWLAKKQITLFNIVPAVLNVWLNTISTISLPHLRYIFSAGEKLSGNLLQNIFSKFDFNGQVINLYGPSETTLAKCYYIASKEDVEKTVLPVGIALPNSEVYVLNEKNFCCNISEVGEIVIRTPYRSYKYLNADNSNFKLLSQSDSPDDLYYFTGDLGSYAKDGNLYVLGRKDNQVKINGVRVELEEIEATIAKVSEVREVAVIFAENIFAFITSTQPEEVLPKVEEELTHSLPEYMHPAKIITVEQLLKNMNGKIDKPGLINLLKEKVVMEPQTITEQKLFSLCCETLNYTHINITDNLLKLGLNSLRQMHLISKIRQSFNVLVSIPDLYKYNTIQQLANHIEQLPQAKQNTIPKTFSEQNLYPASFAQNRMYTLEQFDLDSKAYNILSAFELKGYLDVCKFKQALSIAFKHFAIFSTQFILVNDMLHQQIVEGLALPITERNIHSNEINEAIQALNVKFNLNQAPLINFGLFKLNPEHYIFAYNVHHSIFDGHSHQVLLTTLWDYYLSDKEPSRKELQFYDYASFESKQEGFRFPKKNKEYWLNHLHGELPILNLATDWQRPVQKSSEGKIVSRNLAPELIKRIRNFCQQYNLTSFHFFFGAFAMLLGKYSNQSDLVIGIPALGRYEPETQDMPGMFVETMPLRVDLAIECSVTEYLTKIKQNIISALEHPYPLEQLTSHLSLKRDASRSVLFDVMFAFWEGASKVAHYNGIDIMPLQCHTYTAKFDLMGYIDDNEDNIQITFEYCSKLFRESTVERMLSAYIYLLEQSVVEALELPFKLSIISPQEKNLLLSKYSHTPFVIDPDKLFIEHFQEQCIKMPDKFAVIADDGHLNYQELDLLSSQIASRLQLMGVKHQDRVAILLDRSVKMTAAILGVLKLGAIYVPLDMNYPHERLQYMLEDSNSQIVISTSKLASQFESIYSKAIPFFLDEITDGAVSSFVPALVQAQDTFVIFYTSGTTGKPKGVIQTHLGLINFALYENRENSLTASDNVAFYSSFGFDVSMWSLLLPLICGATTYIIPENIRYSLDEINNYLETNQISIALFPTQMCENFMQQVQNKSLRLLWTAGEKLNKYVPHQYRLINGYGPTEYTGCTTRYEVNCIEENIPIGRPLGNTWIYIVDGNLNLQPLGVPGELCIAGAQIALGYLNKDDQTRERFINNPYSDSNLNRILYKTGDIAKWLENGNLEYIGRVDDQVKIRGFRVELAEIEQVVNSISQINEAVVLAKADVNGHKTLVSYFTSDIKVDIGEIREILLNKLPDYMVPAFINQLPSMPVTTNGKIDRKYLTALEVTVATNEYQIPNSTTEQTLAELWQEILKQPKIGLNDDFFSLGGNSISAIIMGATLNKKIKKIVPIKYLFIYSRLGDFAKFVDSLKNTDIKQGFAEITIDQANLYKPFTMTDVQKAYLVGRENIFELGDVATHVYREDSFKLLDINKFSTILNYLIARHPALRCVYNIDGTQCFLPDTPEYIVRIQDLRNLSEEEQNRHLLSWREELEQQIFDVSIYPLFEFRVSRLSEQDILHFSFDALIMDAQSMRIFMREMTELYQKPQLQLKLLEITFRDYLLGYTELKKSNRYQDDKSYWENRLPELPFGPELVTKCDPASIGTPRFRRRIRRVDAVTWANLAKRIQQAKISPTVPFLTLYGKVLSHWSANKRFLINLTLFSREAFHKDVDNILGDFTILELFEYGNHADYPIGKVLAEVQELLWEDLSHNLYTGLEVQAALHRLYDVGMDKLIAPVVLTSLLGIRHNDDKFLSDDYLGRSYAITQTSQVWLDNKIYEKDGQLVIEWDFVEQLFEVEMIEEMIETYHGFIVDLANKDWDAYLDFTLPERDLEIINLSNKTENPAIMPDKTMHDYFLVSAAKYPDNFAIIEPHAQYTYLDLQAKSAKLANELLVQGVMPGEGVIIYSQKGWQLVAGTLGILISGAAYVPFNITWPIQRLEDIIEIAEVKHIVLTRLQYQKLVNEEFDFELLKVIIIEDICFSDAYSSKTPQVNVGLTDLAYVIFTSGSTGKPKGVEITHIGAMNTINDINHRFNINSQDRTFCLSNISFDLSVYDIFGTLAAGGTAVMPNDEMINQPEELLELLISKQVTVYNSVPALMNILVQSANVPNKACIRLVLLSGDFIPLNLPKKISNTFDNAQVISLGGATEGSIWSILYPITETNPNWTSIPYGTAMGNQKIWIMDEKLKLCPVNVPGEICIGGAGVARGYLADEIKTKAQFIIQENGEVVYRTGDLGVLHRDGNIEIMGRIDHQVKINGFRIELGEIETALASIPSIKNSVVRIIEYSKTRKDIVAYVVPHVYDTLEFKLSKYGIRKFTDNEVVSLYRQNNAKELGVAEAVSFERKSYRGYLSDKIELSELEALLLTPKSPMINLKDNPVPILDLNSTDIFNKLNKILLPFKAFKNIPEVLNKYRYPSAGGLYPVRLYILLGHDYAQNSGYYYYDPEQHCLIKVPVDIMAIPNNGIYVSFNVFYPAIYPYYHERSEAYSYLEAGYMSYLLEINGITTKLAILNPEMATKAEEQVLASYQLINTMPDKLDMPEDAILLVNNLTTFSCYKFQQGKFELITEIDGSFKFGQKGSNLNILRDSAAVLLLSGDDYLAIGKWTQAFTEQILEQNVGSCLFGVFDLGKHVGSLLHQRHFNTAIVLGRVTEEMISVKSLGETGEIAPNNSFIELIKEDLEELLPAYMVPKHIIKLPEFPLTVNGKVNIKALPVPDQIQEQCTIVLPRDKYESDFYQIWEQVLLDMAKVGVENDFFKSGGDSLKAIMLSVKISQVFIRKIPATFVYKNRTIASQAKSIFEYLLQPSVDYATLSDEHPSKILIMYPPFNSGGEAYYALTTYLRNQVQVVAINHYFINYPDSVTNNWMDVLDYYCQQTKKILAQYPNKTIWLGGWSMGGNIAACVFEQLAADYPKIVPQIIVLDSQNKIEKTTELMSLDMNNPWNAYNPDSIMYQQFMAAGYSIKQYHHYVDCSFDILNQMQLTTFSGKVFLIKCLEPIAHFYTSLPDNGWGQVAKEVTIHNLNANHTNILIEPQFIEQVAQKLEEFFKDN